MDLYKARLFPYSSQYSYHGKIKMIGYPCYFKLMTSSVIKEGSNKSAAVIVRMNTRENTP
jgi:hypothetical protein